MIIGSDHASRVKRSEVRSATKTGFMVLTVPVIVTGTVLARSTITVTCGKTENSNSFCRFLMTGSLDDPPACECRR
jgi:hypothetical protein